MTCPFAEECRATLPRDPVSNRDRLISPASGPFSIRTLSVRNGGRVEYAARIGRDAFGQWTLHPCRWFRPSPPCFDESVRIK